MNLRIDNKTSFVDNFLLPLSKIENASVLSINSTGFSSLLAAADNTAIIYATYKKDIESLEPVKLNIPDLNRLIKILNCIPSNDIELEITTNSIKYEGNNIRFTYHLLEDGILSVPPLSVEKIKQLTYDTVFEINYSSFVNLIKGSTFISNLNKIYFFTRDGAVYTELSDKQMHNVDSITFKLSDQYKGTAIETSIPVNFETIRNIINTKFNNAKVHVNNKFNVIAFEVCNENIKNTYIISGLLK